VDFGQLVDFIENRMHMSHVYQPLLIRSLVAAGGTATLRQLALAFLVEDESQILFYEDRIRKMPARILKKHGVIKEHGDLISLTVGPLDYGQRSKVRELCERKLQAFLQQRGLDAWASRMIETDPVPPALRYQALMRSAGRCVLCGATKEETTLHVDHILPRSRGGKNTIDNLQVLCATCNEAESNRDTTDLRAGLLVAETAADPACPFCGPDLRSKAVARNELCFAVPHPRSPVAGHLVVVPFRHAPEFLALTADERRDCEDHLRALGNESRSADGGIRGFTVLSGGAASKALATSHAHVHLIPERDGSELATIVGDERGAGSAALRP